MYDNPSKSPSFRVLQGGEVIATDTNFENFGVWFDGAGTSGELVRCNVKCLLDREAAANVVVLDSAFVSLMACILEGGSTSIMSCSLETMVLVHGSVLDGAGISGVVAMRSARRELHNCALQISRNLRF